MFSLGPQQKLLFYANIYFGFLSLFEECFFLSNMGSIM
jgi:hypothetical protein